MGLQTLGDTTMMVSGLASEIPFFLALNDLV